MKLNNLFSLPYICSNDTDAIDISNNQSTKETLFQKLGARFKPAFASTNNNIENSDIKLDLMDLSNNFNRRRFGMGQSIISSSAVTTLKDENGNTSGVPFVIFKGLNSYHTPSALSNLLEPVSESNILIEIKEKAEKAEEKTEEKITTKRPFTFQTIHPTDLPPPSPLSIPLQLSPLIHPDTISQKQKYKPFPHIMENVSSFIPPEEIIKKNINNTETDVSFVLSKPLDALDALDALEEKKETVESSPTVSNPQPPRHEEYQYLDLVREIIEKGSYETGGRNGNTYTKFGHSMRFSLQDGQIPILTTKKLAWRVCFEELFWFIRGSTSNLELQEKKVHIWDANASREFLDSRGLYYLEENDLGPIYGHQWRHFNAEYTNNKKSYFGEGIDQLAEIIDNLKNPKTRASRRHIMIAWNPCQINTMALPPCHVMAQFHVRDGKYLSCALFQRSGDVGLGVPFNIASYSLLTHILAKHCDLEADEFVHFLGNCHIYEEHVEPLKTQLLREPKDFPKIGILNQYENIEDYHLEDIFWKTPYEFHENIKMKMIA